ncbi:bifunctional uridylyltransferase/uridylyl-removing protein GlnD [Volucribacter amazonae]|uniref:Bifunctional uridylyltransferase/uridylyl-removing enzyme n=1 Tax=Volucribacter amazonae TaxID=256731 RepID=A0A9X4SGX1_9PAST|nr:bifunctional uridylyltransferase/uridylyl-removing protein GlnD [Volucribacter amazonae]MDG6894057.1 bifunctional uridylyltransferase/uridylyl-removing protein [Volucribacter amazonae]MDG6896361.1 bifunctional uridylyltransferase/uridylyl-removing protein [Volucribacter amazonae]
MALFSYQAQPIPTVENIKQQKNALAQRELAHFNQANVYELIAQRNQFCDDLLCHLWQYFALNQQPDLALIAVGGYGRQEIFPLSDLDFLILSQSAICPETEQKIAQFIQFLWDCHFDIGHSVRSLTQCIEEGKKDISIATNLLESRYLCGNQQIFAQLESAVHYQADFWPAADFFQAKLQEKNERYQRYHNTSYNLEPDIKNSPGGLRDLHLLYWIALRHTKAKNLSDILQAGFIYPEEYACLQQSQHFLFRTRFALHLILKRYDNRLLFDRQLKISQMLGFGEGNQGVEKLMKVFFQSLQHIALLSHILLKHYQEHFLTSPEKTSAVDLDDNFCLLGQSILLKNKSSFTQQPESILDLFYYLTQHHKADIHSETLRELVIALGQLNSPLCQYAKAREKFIQLLAQPQAISRAFFPMHQYGVLTAYLPQWQPIVGLMQFDLFHTYTVDEHTLRVMLKLESFLQQENQKLHPLCTQLFPQLADRRLLYLAGLFHDIAKGRGGDHAELGAKEMQDFAILHGFNATQTELMCWLVQQHLFMSITAQRRDIHDPEVVLAFADKVKDQQHLDYLVCLTVADICATNGTLWNDWKRTLLFTLYQYCSQQFDQGMQHRLDYQQQIAQNRQQALILLKALPEQSIQALWQQCPDEYFLRNTPKQIAWHSQLLYENQDNLVVKVSNKFAKGGTEIFIYCADQPSLFHKVVSIIGTKNLSIHDAQIITRQDGYVMDSFIVSELDGSLVRNERRRALEKALYQGLTTPAKALLNQRRNYKLQHFQVPTQIRFLNIHRSDHTEMELFALDKAGLLSKISQVFVEQQLNLLNAKITTIGEKAEDFFILVNAEGKALCATQRQQLEQRLVHTLAND